MRSFAGDPGARTGPQSDTTPVALDVLARYPYFDRLAPTILKKVQPHAFEVQFDVGQHLLRQHDYSDTAYYVDDGAVDVRLSAEDGTDSTVRLGPGEIVGELAALSRYPVIADVVATEPTRCLAIRTPALRLMLKQTSLRDFKAFIDDRYRHRTLGTHLHQSGLFDELDDAALQALKAGAELQSFDPGDTIVAEGATDDALYLVRGGSLQLTVRVGASALAVGVLERGGAIGEHAVLTGAPWTVSVETLDHVELVRLPRPLLAEALDCPPVTARLRRAVDDRRAAVDAARRDPLQSRHLQMAIETGLVGGDSVLLIDMEKCTGCDDCVRACASLHDGTPRFIRTGPVYERWSIPIACHQCTNPPCLVGCPTGAITRRPGTIAVTINKDTCIGCGVCADRCPWDRIIAVPHASATLNRTIPLATKCDLCEGRARGPACVEQCPHGAALRVSLRDPSTTAARLTP